MKKLNWDMGYWISDIGRKIKIKIKMKLKIGDVEGE